MHRRTRAAGRNAGAANVKARGLVPVTGLVAPADRDRIRAAAALAGDGSIAKFAARVLTEAAAAVLDDHDGTKKNQESA